MANYWVVKSKEHNEVLREYETQTEAIQGAKDLLLETNYRELLVVAVCEVVTNTIEAKNIQSEKMTIREARAKLFEIENQESIVSICL